VIECTRSVSQIHERMLPCDSHARVQSSRFPTGQCCNRRSL